LLAIVDTSAATTKKILVSELSQAMVLLGTEQATTAGTSIDFNSIPAWVKRITIMFKGVSTNGSSNIIVQIGDSGGIENSGYLGTCAAIGGAAANFTASFGLTNSITAASVLHGTMTLTLENAAAFSWVATGIVSLSDTTGLNIGSGSKSLSAALDRVRITTNNGTDAFDAGAINVIYE